MSIKQINQLRLEEKIGQLFVFGFDALDINDHAINLIKHYKAGNIILFARNVKTPKQLHQLNQNLQKLAQEEIGIPLFITIDQEGGMVSRIKNGATFFPGAMTIGATNEPKHAYVLGDFMGKELKQLGINMNLAPDLDVNNNPYNPVIGVRSYSDDPSKVSAFGSMFVKGLQKHIIATGKHFPGHGDTQVDSHLALPVIDKNKDALFDVELKPFQKVIDECIHAIMTSHINFPAFTENNKPCTLSKNCLTGLLRNQLGFKGLIITDCMQMKAIQHTYTTPRGALMAIEAGADLVCVSHSESLQIEAIQAVTKAVKDNMISIDVINKRVNNVLKYKAMFARFEMPSYEHIKQDVVNDQHKQYSYDVVRQAVTQIKGSPFKQKGLTLLIASHPLSTTIADENDGNYSLIAAAKKALPAFHTKEVSVQLDQKEIEEILDIQDNYDQIVFCSYNANIYKHQQSLLKTLQAQNNLYVLMMRNPYDTVFVKELKQVVAFYEFTPNSIKAAIDYLKEELNPEGRCPVQL